MLQQQQLNQKLPSYMQPTKSSISKIKSKSSRIPIRSSQNKPGPASTKKIDIKSPILSKIPVKTRISKVSKDPLLLVPTSMPLELSTSMPAIMPAKTPTAKSLVKLVDSPNNHSLNEFNHVKEMKIEIVPANAYQENDHCNENEINEGNEGIGDNRKVDEKKETTTSQIEQTTNSQQCHNPKKLEKIQKHQHHPYHCHLQEDCKPTIIIKIPLSPKYIQKLPLIPVIDMKEATGIPKEDKFKHLFMVLISILLILSL